MNFIRINSYMILFILMNLFTVNTSICKASSRDQIKKDYVYKDEFFYFEIQFISESECIVIHDARNTLSDTCTYRIDGKKLILQGKNERMIKLLPYCDFKFHNNNELLRMKVKGGSYGEHDFKVDLKSK